MNYLSQLSFAARHALRKAKYVLLSALIGATTGVVAFNLYLSTQ